jgi:MSHA biogenesis protein MshL
MSRLNMWKDRNNLTSFALVLLVVSVLGSCATPPDVPPISEAGQLRPEHAIKTGEDLSAKTKELEVAGNPSSVLSPQPFSLEDRMSLGKPGEGFNKSKPAKQMFSFRAQDMPLSDALRLFARVNELNIVVGPDVVGEVTVDFQGLSLDRAMAALLETHGFFWEKQDELIIVRRFETRAFTLDYIRLERGGSGRNKAQVTSGSGGGQDAGEVSLSQQDQIKFWEELEAQVKALLSQDGRVVVNRLSGTIQVTDLHKRVEEVSQFLVNVRQSLYRQVEIEARIYEVTLSDDYSLGINWNRIDFETKSGSIGLTNIITAAAGGFTIPAATAAISFVDGSFDVVLEALHQQGQVKIVSQPRILTLNNQPALIKVGTDQSFFSSTTTQGVGGSGNIITEQVRTVTSGLVLSVTPQISQDGWIMMDVSPIITTLGTPVESPNGSTAPTIDVKQSGGLVRVKDGEMVIIGGLIQDQLADTERKVPVLGDIPGLGRLFKGTFQAKRKTELVIFLTAQIRKVS